MLMVAAADAGQREAEFVCRAFGSTSGELDRLRGWLRELGVVEVVMESTAQYWKPVWPALEPQFRRQLAQARRSSRSALRR